MRPLPIYGTLSSLVIAALVQYLPYGMRFCHAGAMQIHRELEEAAEMSGARKFATFVRIVLPLIAPAVATSWLFVMLMSVRAVAMPILLVGPRSQVVAVTLFDLWGNGQITSLAAVGVVLDCADDVHRCDLLSLRPPLWPDRQLNQVDE